MRLAIATVCLSGTLDRKLSAIAAAGFGNVELFESDLVSFSGSPRAVRRMIDDLGLRIVTYQPFRDFEGMVGSARAKAFSRAERKMDLMGELGCDLMMVCSNVSPEAQGGIDRAADDFHELGERAAARGIRVAYEALAWGRHVHDYRDAWEIVRRADHPAIGLVLDSFHTLVRQTDLRPMRSIPSDRIFLVQMADAPWLEMDYMSWSRHFRCFPGQGDLPVDAFVDALGSTGYRGILSLEIFSDRFRAGSAHQVAIDGRRSLLVLLDELRQRSGEGGEAWRLPPRASCDGIEFVEFTLGGEDRPAFEAMLGKLGFRKLGQHRSKDVARWGQGEINIVVNADKSGFAQSYYLTHGPSVCAIALRVDDAKDAVRRATALLDEPFTQAIGPGELEIPAVRGLGGSLIYFVDRKAGLDHLWEVDFLAVADRGERPGGLERIDHIQQAMQYEEMLSWVLFYTSLLRMSATPVVDVIDPGGLVQSQALATADGSLRLALNATQSPQTRAARFLGERFGAGYHHIAFTTRDIGVTAAALAGAGLMLLPIPDNYYDDLAARTTLSDAEVSRLRANGILYDQDGSGEFFQVYTTDIFGGAFFVEIVERRDGYAGFGAVNAPIRLAAQTLIGAQTDAPD